MRKYAYLKKPLKRAENELVYKIMFYDTGSGVYLFEYSDPDAVLSSSDLWYDTLEDLYDEWDALIDGKGWIDLDDPLPGCQHDALIPLRVKGRDTGKPEWGSYETLKDGKWIPYGTPQERSAELDIDGLEQWHFELTESACNALLDLVLQGKKRATSSSLAGYEISGEKAPVEGDLSIITDWDGNPRCVIRTVRVTHLPYKDISFDLAKLEGEDDTLNSWKKNHEKFFREEGRELGYEFTEDMTVVFEEFEVVEILS